MALSRPSTTLGLLKLLLFLLLLPAISQATYKVQEICQFETFSASCSENEVLLIANATYGRLQMGRCLKSDFGFLGCGNDVKPLVERECAGRQNCSLIVSKLHGGPLCNPDLIAYLLVEFTCIPVIPCKKDLCSTNRPLKLPLHSGYISSSVASRTSCGSSNCPWILEAQSGQTIYLILTDFSHLNASVAKSSIERRFCRRYATVKEGTATTDLTFCSHGWKRQTTYISKTYSLEIVLYSSGSKKASGPQFLLKYEVRGCPDIKLPRHSTVEKKEDQMIVKCLDSEQSWQLTCTGTSWVGETGVCGGDGGGAFQIGSALNKTSSSPYGLLIVIGLGLALGVVVGVILLACVVFYMRRVRRRRLNSANKTRSLLSGSSPMRDSSGKDLLQLDRQAPPGYDIGYIPYPNDHNYTTTMHLKNPQLDQQRETSKLHTEREGYEKSVPRSSTPASSGTSKDHPYEVPSFPFVESGSGYRRNSTGCFQGIQNESERCESNYTN